MGTVYLVIGIVFVAGIFLPPTLLPLYLWLDEIWSERKETKRFLENC